MDKNSLENEIKVTVIPHPTHCQPYTNYEWIKFLHEDYKRNMMSVIVNGVSLKRLMNALRRISKSQVSTLAIEKIIFEAGEHSHEPEFCAQLAKIPLLSNDVNNFADKQDCKCERGPHGKYCSNCCVEFSLTIEGTSKHQVIKSEQLVSNHPSVKVVYNDIIIARLEAKKTLKLKALAFKGTGKQNANWNPTVIFTYEKQKQPEYFTKTFDKTNGRVKKDFKIDLESSGSLSPLEILYSTSDAIEQGLNCFLSKIKEMKF